MLRKQDVDNLQSVPQPVGAKTKTMHPMPWSMDPIDIHIGQLNTAFT